MILLKVKLKNSKVFYDLGKKRKKKKICVEAVIEESSSWF